jgi:hypothetical protein
MPITTGRRAFGNRCFMSGGHDRVDVARFRKTAPRGLRVAALAVPRVGKGPE